MATSVINVVVVVVSVDIGVDNFVVVVVVSVDIGVDNFVVVVDAADVEVGGDAVSQTPNEVKDLFQREKCVMS